MPEQEQPKIEATPRLPSIIDLVTRTTASALVLVYGLGFVILGFHDAQYGVVQFSPFRARIVLVGFVFAMLVALAAAAYHYRFAYIAPLESVVRDLDPQRHRHRETVLTTGFIFTALVMASLLGLFFFQAQKQQFSKWRLLAWPTAYALALGIFEFVNKTFSKKPLRAAILSLTAFFIFFVGLSEIVVPSTVATLAIMFALVALSASTIKRHPRKLEYALDFRNWISLLLLLWIYIGQIFSTLPPRWGGGQPTPVVIFQNAPAPWSPSNPMDALLLDETDQGFYVLLRPAGKAFFAPRSNVTTVFFGTREDLKKK